MADRLADVRPRADSEIDAELRRKRRSSWTIRRFELGSEPSDDLSAGSTAGERLAMVWPLTLLSWRLAGRTIPEYERGSTPGRVVRASSPD